MSETDRDPRPDLRDDHMLWASVLIIAHKIDGAKDLFDTERSIFGLLHGLRCAGARLNKLENGSLKLDYQPLLKVNGGTWDKEPLLDEWLYPFRKEMSMVFRQAVS